MKISLCAVMAASLPSDTSDLESNNRSEIAESDAESDISVSSVNTEDLHVQEEIQGMLLLTHI